MLVAWVEGWGISGSCCQHYWDGNLDLRESWNRRHQTHIPREQVFVRPSLVRLPPDVCAQGQHMHCRPASSYCTKRQHLGSKRAVFSQALAMRYTNTRFQSYCEGSTKFQALRGSFFIEPYESERSDNWASRQHGRQLEEKEGFL
jgi:hypothetical protein